jgi:hypothetical protein
MLKRVVDWPVWTEDENFPKIQNCAERLLTREEFGDGRLAHPKGLDLVSDLISADDHNAQEANEILAGILWDKSSCSLDAMLLMLIIILEAVGPGASLEQETSRDLILRKVLDCGRIIAKTPWSQRYEDMMTKYRNAIREDLLAGPKITISGTSRLSDFDERIVPRSFMEFGMAIRLSCSGCRRVVGLPQCRMRGLTFYQWSDTNLQKVLDSLVCNINLRTKFRYKRDTDITHENGNAKRARERPNTIFGPVSNLFLR